MFSAFRLPGLEALGSQGSRDWNLGLQGLGRQSLRL